MKTIRVVLRLLGLTLWTLLILPFPILCWLCLLGRERPYARCAPSFVAFWSHGLLWIFGVRVQASGTPPAPGTFIASNHLSYLDIMVLASCYRTNFVAKSEIAGWPVIGWLCRLVGTIFIDRERARDTLRVGELLNRFLDYGVTITLFAEGTSWRGDEILPFKASLFSVPARLGRPCVPVSLTYRTPGDGPGVAGPEEGSPHINVCWWGDAPFAPHILNFLRVRRTTCQVRFGEPIEGLSDRKQLASACRARVVEMFEPVPQ